MQFELIRSSCLVTIVPTWRACAGGQTGVKAVDVKAQMHGAIATEEIVLTYIKFVHSCNVFSDIGKSIFTAMSAIPIG